MHVQASFCMAGAMGFCTLSKVSQTCGYSKTVAGVGHLERNCKDACRVAAAVHETSSEMLGGQGADFLRDAGDDADDEDFKDSKEEEVLRRRGSGVVAGETHSSECWPGSRVTAATVRSARDSKADAPPEANWVGRGLESI